MPFNIYAIIQKSQQHKKRVNMLHVVVYDFYTGITDYYMTIAGVKIV